MTPRRFFNTSGIIRVEVLKTLLMCRRLILLLDFDGTLAPIRTTPSAARMPAATRKQLRLLSRHPNVIAGIVTGRSMPDILKKVGKDHLLLIANHGFEIFHEGVRWVHPWAERVVPLMNQIARALQRRLRGIPGALIENKRYTLAIHYRNVHKKNVPIVHDAVFDLASSHQRDCRITEGKKVIEVRPRIPWSKGTAVQRVLKILKRKRQSCVIYIGDDATDEDAFEVLRGSGITIVVGRKKSSHAAYWVRNPGEVRDFLALLAVLTTERAAR